MTRVETPPTPMPLHHSGHRAPSPDGLTTSTTDATDHPRWLWWYLAVAFAWSWSWWLPMALAGVVTRAGQGWPTHLVGLAGPAVAAVVVTAWSQGAPGLRALGRRATRWRIGWRWWLLVLATLALVSLGPLAAWWRGDALRLAELGRYSGAPEATTLAAAVLIGGYVLLVNGIGEELGWRGFLADRLLRRYGLPRVATLVWVVWALWHAPLFVVVENFRGFGLAGAAGWLVGLWFGSYLLAWLYRSTGGSVLLVASWHTAYNVSTATDSGAGLPAAVTSTLVMAAVAILLFSSVREVRQ